MDRTEMMKAFMHEMYRYVPPDARIMACAFRGDPNADIKGKWRAHPATTMAHLDDGANVYLAVSAMKRNAKGEFRRRKENFAGGVLLMIDDLGDGPGSKFPLRTLKIPPTALIETSPGNHQAVYMFSSLITDIIEMEGLISGFIARQFLGHDPGMAGVNRVFRPPYGVNGKPKYGGWQVVARQWAPEARYSIAELTDAFGIELIRPVRAPHGATVGRSESIRAFVTTRTALREAGMLKREEADMSGWQDIVCPWTAGHTDHANNGAAIREPAEENGWVGAFRCHHGGCEGKGWRELTDWLSEDQSEALESVNAASGSAKDWL